MSPEEIIRDLRQLPSTPKVLPKLLEILRDDQASMGDVVSLIKIDAGMAAKVLQIGNSAYYSPSHAARCPTMEDAVYRVGLVKVYELVAYAATAQLLMRPLRAYNMEAPYVWQISVTCALAAERLARHVDVDFNTAYTAGLLHAIGLVAVDTWASTLESPLHFLNGGLPNETTDSEKSTVGFTNAAVAGSLLKTWAFPTAIIEPIRWQYAPSSAGAHKKMAALIHTAKWLRDAAHVEAEKPLPAPPDPAILALLKLEPSDLEASLDEVKDAFLKASLLLAEPADNGA
jgi:HD-like signal output (HDOD) protein